jgi:hypothetical protein
MTDSTDLAVWLLVFAVAAALLCGPSLAVLALVAS